MIECLIVVGCWSLSVLVIMAWLSDKPDREIRQDKLYLFKKETSDDDHGEL